MINEKLNYNDNQPVVLIDEVVEGNHKNCIYLKFVSLMPSNERLECRTVRFILCHHEPNPDKYPKKYGHH